MWTLNSVSSTLISTSDAYFRSEKIQRCYGNARSSEWKLTRTDGQYMRMTRDSSVCEQEKRGVIMVVWLSVAGCVCAGAPSRDGRRR